MFPQKIVLPLLKLSREGQMRYIKCKKQKECFINYKLLTIQHWNKRWLIKDQHLIRGGIITLLQNKDPFKKKTQHFIYLFLERGREGEREGETLMCGCLTCAPYYGPGPQPQHMPWLGIERATLWFTGWHSIHWATPARAEHLFLIQGVSVYWAIIMYQTLY